MLGGGLWNKVSAVAAGNGSSCRLQLRKLRRSSFLLHKQKEDESSWLICLTVFLWELKFSHFFLCEGRAADEPLCKATWQTRSPDMNSNSGSHVTLLSYQTTSSDLLVLVGNAISVLEMLPQKQHISISSFFQCTVTIKQVLLKDPFSAVRVQISTVRKGWLEGCCT